ACSMPFRANIRLHPGFEPICCHSRVPTRTVRMTYLRLMEVNKGDEAPKVPGGRAPWIVIAGIFVAGLIAGMILTGAATAQTPSPSAGAKENGKHFKGFGHGFGHGRFGGGIHGEFVVPKPGGGYQTVLTQIGTVQS